MAKLIFAAVLCVLGLAASRTLAPLAASPRPPAVAHAQRLTSSLALALGVAVPALIILLSIFKVIPAGHVGVATLFGSVQPRPLAEGLNFINPLLDVTLMSTQVQRRAEKYDAASQDLQAVHIEMVLNYRLPRRAARCGDPDRDPPGARAVQVRRWARRARPRRCSRSAASGRAAATWAD